MKKRLTIERTFHVEVAESELILVIGQLLKCRQEKSEPPEKEESAGHEQGDHHNQGTSESMVQGRSTIHPWLSGVYTPTKETNKNN